MLKKFPDERLGYKNILNIRCHKIFRGINWEKVKSLGYVPTFVPRRICDDLDYVFVQLPKNNDKPKDHLPNFDYDYFKEKEMKKLEHEALRDFTEAKKEFMIDCERLEKEKQLLQVERSELQLKEKEIENEYSRLQDVMMELLEPTTSSALDGIIQDDRVDHNKSFAPIPCDEPQLVLPQFPDVIDVQSEVVISPVANPVECGETDENVIDRERSVMQKSIMEYHVRLGWDIEVPTLHFRCSTLFKKKRRYCFVTVCANCGTGLTLWSYSHANYMRHADNHLCKKKRLALTEN